MGVTRMGRQEAAVVARLVSLLTPAYPALDERTQAAVQRDVTAFVATQIQAMPSFLRLPYRFAVVAFNWLAVLRYGQPFLGLGDTTARAYLSLWSSARLGPTRDFVKLIRSCALLAYFDHAQVRAGLETAAPLPPATQRAIGNGLD